MSQIEKSLSKRPGLGGILLLVLAPLSWGAKRLSGGHSSTPPFLLPQEGGETFRHRRRSAAILAVASSLTVNSVRVRLVRECFDLRRARRHDKAATLVLSRSDVRGEKVMVRIHWRRRIYWRHLL